MSDIEVLPAVAKNVLMDCKKCAEERYHRVLAHKTPTSAKVECEICGSKKTFKIGVKKKKASTSTRAKKLASKNVAPTLWEDLNKKIDTDSAGNYSIKGNFELNTALDHTKFGMGFITKVYDKKIEVCFQDSIRTLVHNH